MPHPQIEGGAYFVIRSVVDAADVEITVCRLHAGDSAGVASRENEEVLQGEVPVCQASHEDDSPDAIGQYVLNEPAEVVRASIVLEGAVMATYNIEFTVALEGFDPDSMEELFDELSEAAASITEDDFGFIDAEAPWVSFRGYTAAGAVVVV